MELQERVLRSKNDEQEFEKLLREYMPFIVSCTSRTVGRYVDEHDDETSVAIIAFSEAVQRFRPESGKFLMYAKKVIHSRLVDGLRKEKRTVKTVSLDTLSYGEHAQGTVKENIEIAKQPESMFDDPVKLEIQTLSAMLQVYGFTFMDLPQSSPKHKKTKNACAKIIRHILQTPGLLQKMKDTKQLPVKEIQESTGISRKLIERHRKYIVCSAEILSGEYVYLAGYLNFIEEEVS